MITYRMILDRINSANVYPTASYWDRVAESSYGDSGTLLYLNPVINEIYHGIEHGIVRGWAGDVNGMNVLDIGCGAGRYCRDLADGGAQVTGIDFSSKSIEIAKRLSPNKNIRYLEGSIYELSGEQKYDLVVCSRVLAVACRSQPDVKTCLERIYAVLKPGGRAIFIEPVHRSFMRRVLKMNLQEFRSVLTAVDLRVLDVRQAEFYPARILLAYFRLPEKATRLLFECGEAISRIVPATTDQKFILVQRPG